jgi:hypothetical protein
MALGNDKQAVNNENRKLNEEGAGWHLFHLVRIGPKFLANNQDKIELLFALGAAFSLHHRGHLLDLERVTK